jgi:uncharacterized protein (DUF934 family)
MPLLDRTGEKSDAWRRVAAAEIGAEQHALVPFADLAEARAATNGEIGVEIANTVRLEDLAADLDRLALIAVAFPSYSDGRGFSIARQLRKAGYKGVLRAVGPIIADQFAYALACGFDEVELPAALAARQPVAQYISAAHTIRAAYQRGYTESGASILERRRAAQRGNL